jgi:hypothetical protein
VDRRNKLTAALVADGIDAFIVEPGFTFKYVGLVLLPIYSFFPREPRVEVVSRVVIAHLSLRFSKLRVLVSDEALSSIKFFLNL